MPPLTSSNHTGKTPSSIPNSKLVSHWIASWSCGTSWSTSRSSASRRASYAGSRAPWCSGTTNALMGASGVGRQTWKRQVTGTRPPRGPGAGRRGGGRGARSRGAVQRRFRLVVGEDGGGARGQGGESRRDLPAEPFGPRPPAPPARGEQPPRLALRRRGHDHRAY